jgi:hypothetical protein
MKAFLRMASSLGVTWMFVLNGWYNTVSGVMAALAHGLEHTASSVSDALLSCKGTRVKIKVG